MKQFEMKVKPCFGKHPPSIEPECLLCTDEGDCEAITLAEERRQAVKEIERRIEGIDQQIKRLKNVRRIWNKALKDLLDPKKWLEIQTKESERIREILNKR